TMANSDAPASTATLAAPNAAKTISGAGQALPESIVVFATTTTAYGCPAASSAGAAPSERTPPEEAGCAAVLTFLSASAEEASADHAASLGAPACSGAPLEAAITVPCGESTAM